MRRYPPPSMGNEWNMHVDTKNARVTQNTQNVETQCGIMKDVKLVVVGRDYLSIWSSSVHFSSPLENVQPLF